MALTNTLLENKIGRAVGLVVTNPATGKVLEPGEPLMPPDLLPILNYHIVLS